MATHIKKILERFQEIVPNERQITIVARFLDEFNGAVSPNELSINHNTLFIKNPLKKIRFLLQKKQLLMRFKSNPFLKHITNIK